MIIEMEPLDVLFFRDSKPFNKGEDNWANSLPFPNLTTIYGMLRSTYFSMHMEQFHLVNKESDQSDPTKKIQIENVNLVYQDKEYYPIPEDLFCFEDKDGFQFRYKKCVESKNMISSLHTKTGLIYSMKKPDAYSKQKPIDTSFLRLDKKNLNAYFNKGKIRYFDFHDKIFEESKIGIGRSDESKCSEEGLLYRIGQVRYGMDVKIRVEINDGILELPARGVLRLGGQGNSVSYKIINKLEEKRDNPKKKKCNRLKIYLKNPAVFKNGWKPDFIEGDSLEGVIDEKKVRLLTACINGYFPIGGYDLKNNCPKPLVKAVPAGSVYLFELMEECEEVNLKEIKLLSKMDDDIYEKCGYGKAFCCYYKEDK